MSGEKILIVDDEAFNVDYLEQELQEIGYVTVSAVNGVEALEKIIAESPDLVLLDIMMPLMDGYEVLRRVKADPEIRDIPIIVISADSGLQSVVRGIELGAEEYLPKPFEPVLLHARITSCLEKKHLRDVQRLYLKSLQKEFEIARDIQQEFLPAELPQLEGWEVAAYFKAAKDVAGDFYDAFLLADGSLVTVVGDVCGKGVGAALFMTLFRSLIRASATTDEFIVNKEGKRLSIGERLQHVIKFTNNYIATTHEDANMFATVFLCCIDPVAGALSYINCGNEPALLTDAGGVREELGPTGPVIGLFADTEYGVKQVVLAPGQTLLAFTDGIPDALDAAEKTYGRERLIKSVPGGGTAAVLVERVTQKLLQHIDRSDQFDDITLVAVQRK